MAQILETWPSEFRSALIMNSVYDFQIRVALLIAVLSLGGFTVAPAASAQDLQTGTQLPLASQTLPQPTGMNHVAPAPVVSYQNGQLTIIAENVSLSEIMSLLHSVMGAQTDLPAGSSDERIWARLGPGPARKVLSDLLSNTDLNFVIQGSLKDADGIQTVMLTARSDDPSRKLGNSMEAATSMDDQEQSRADSRPALSPEPEMAASQHPPTEPAAATDAPSVAAEAQPPIATLPVIPSRPSSLTTDQMVQQLTNMYQQRKQIQLSQNGSMPN
jgi:hypothetical protein